MGRGIKLTIDANDILGWELFHTVFAEKLGFPAFYGRNMDAWIDCLWSIRTPSDGMTNVHLADDEILSITINNAKLLIDKEPEILEWLSDSCSFLNGFVSEGTEPIIALAYELGW